MNNKPIIVVILVLSFLLAVASLLIYTQTKISYKFDYSENDYIESVENRTSIKSIGPVTPNDIIDLEITIQNKKDEPITVQL